MSQHTYRERHSYGLCGYDLYSHGMYSYGLYSYGLHGYGFYMADMTQEIHTGVKPQPLSI